MEAVAGTGGDGIKVLQGWVGWVQFLSLSLILIDMNTIFELL